MQTAVWVDNKHEWNALQAIEIHKGHRWNGGSTNVSYDENKRYIVLSGGGSGIMQGSFNSDDYTMLTFKEYMTINFRPSNTLDDHTVVHTPNDATWYTVQLIEASRGLPWQGGGSMIDKRGYNLIYIQGGLSHGNTGHSHVPYFTFEQYLAFRLTGKVIKPHIPFDSVLPNSLEGWRLIEDIEHLKGRRWSGGNQRVTYRPLCCISIDKEAMTQGDVKYYKKAMSVKQYLNFNRAYVKQIEEIEASKPARGTPERVLFDVQEAFPEHLRLSKDIKRSPVVFDLKDNLSPEYHTTNMAMWCARKLSELLIICPLLKGSALRIMLRNKLYPVLINAISEGFFDNYYQKNGSKITKKIKGIVKKIAGKELTDKIFPKFCGELAKCYLKQETLVAFMADKSNLGEGLLETGATCFRRRSGKGENYMNGLFLDKNKRFQMLALYSVSSGSFARCIAHFIGGRKVELFNFYFQDSFTQNNKLFIEAFRRLFNLKKVTFKQEAAMELPIYYNNDSLVISANRAFGYTRAYRWACPYCSTKVLPSTFVTREAGYIKDLACSEDCLTVSAEDANNSFECCCCEESFSRDDRWTNSDGDGYCDSCYHERYSHCVNCEAEVLQDDGIEVGGYHYCEGCAGSCRDCGENHINNDLYDGLCDACYSEQNPTCAECGDEHDKANLEDGICPDCEEKSKEGEEQNEAIA